MSALFLSLIPLLGGEHFYDQPLARLHLVVDRGVELGAGRQNLVEIHFVTTIGKSNFFWSIRTHKNCYHIVDDHGSVFRAVIDESVGLANFYFCFRNNWFGSRYASGS